MRERIGNIRGDRVDVSPLMRRSVPRPVAPGLPFLPSHGEISAVSHTSLTVALRLAGGTARIGAEQHAAAGRGAFAWCGCNSGGPRRRLGEPGAWRARGHPSGGRGAGGSAVSSPTPRASPRSAAGRHTGDTPGRRSRTRAASGRPSASRGSRPLPTGPSGGPAASKSRCRARNHCRSPRRPRPQHAVIEHEIHARPRHEHRQAGQEGPRLEDQVRGAIALRATQLHRDVSVGSRGDPLLGERRPERIPADALEWVA